MQADLAITTTNDKGEVVAVLEAFYGYALGEASALKRIVSA